MNIKSKGFAIYSLLLLVCGLWLVCLMGVKQIETVEQIELLPAGRQVLKLLNHATSLAVVIVEK